LDNFSISEEGLGLAACIEYDAQRWWYAPSTLSVEIEKNKLWFTNRRLWLDEHVAEIQYLWKTYTATFDNAGAWENVYAYAWYNDGVTVQKLLGDWPGVELKKNEETGLYDVTIENTKIPEKIVFSDGTISNGVVGKNQTKDFVFENDKLYVWNEYAVTFSTNRNWDSVYAYAWSDDEPKDEYSELWPGTLLERIESVYEYRFHAEKEPQWIVFNDGTIEDNMEATNKTETYNFVNNKEYIDNTSTAIHNIQQRNQRDSIIYNLNGQRVKNAVKGLYIINGKIVSVKY
jgi:hypothetical protein